MCIQWSSGAHSDHCNIESSQIVMPSVDRGSITYCCSELSTYYRTDISTVCYYTIVSYLLFISPTFTFVNL